MKKTLLCSLLALVMVLGFALTAAPDALAADTQTEPVTQSATEHQDHCVCGGHGFGLGSHTCTTATNWTPWGDDDAEKTKLPTAAGNYYLVSDINPKASTTLSASVNLCLNGHTITGAGEGIRVFYPGACTLSITDCGAEASWGTIRNNYTSWYGGLIYMNTTATSKGTVNLYAGNFVQTGTVIWGGILYSGTGSTVNIYKANLTGSVTARRFVNDSQGTRDGRGGAIFAGNSANLNIYGGTISGGSAQNAGGNIYIMSGTLNLHGGTISGGRVDASLGTLTDGMAATGGNIAVEKGTLNVYGGTITGGTSTGTGGNIALLSSGAELNISGGEIIDGVASGHGGNITQASGTTITMTGGTVSGGKTITATGKQGGNINTGAGSLTVSGGTVKDGRATGYGGNICATPGGIINISGNAIISGGKTGSVASEGTDGTTGSGGNIFAGNNADTHSTLTISGGTISGGFAKVGGNVTFDGNGAITGGTISGGKTPTTSGDNKGGNVYITAGAGTSPISISGGTISGGQSFYGGNLYITGSTTAPRTVNMTGGTIAEGTVTGVDSCGGNIFVAGILNLEDGIIRDGLCKTSNNSCGGNIYLSNTVSGTQILSSVNMTGGLISGGRSEQGGGGSIQVHGLFYMYGGEITGGQSKYGGCVRVYRPGHFILDGGKVSEGRLSHISDGNGGAVFMVEGNAKASAGTKLGTLTIKSGTVIGNTDTKTVNGGAIMVGNNGVCNIEGGTINGGRGNNYVYQGTARIGAGGAIYCYSTGSNTAELNISGGTINGGLAESFGGLLAVKPASTGLVDINITGGTFNGGKAPLGAVMYLGGSNVDMDITGGEFIGGQADTKGSLFWLGSGADVTVSGGSFTCGSAPVAQGFCITGGKLTLDGKPTFAGDGSMLYVENPDSLVLADSLETTVSVTAPYVGKIAAAATDKAACLTSRSVSLTYDPETQAIYANGLLLAQNGTAYSSVAEAMAEGSTVLTLMSNHEGSAEINEKLWLNLNGFTFTGALTGTGTLYGYDTATDDYDLSDMGHLTGTVSCTLAPHFQGTGADIVQENRYMAIADETGYTFRRFDLKVTHMSIRPGTEGVGYKATVYGDKAVLDNIASVGYSLQLEGEDPVSMEKAFDPAKTVVTLRIDGYGIAKFGQTPLAATARLTLKDGAVVESKAVSRTFQDMLEAVNDVLDNLTNPQTEAIKTLCQKYSDTVKDWDVADIMNWVDPRIPTTEQMEGIDPANIYYVGPTREYTSVTKLFMDLEDDTNEKIIFLDEGTYDIFREYRELDVPTPPDDVQSPDYFPYCVFLPANTRLIGLGDVLLDFSPEADEITYGESRTWSPLNIIAPCYIENIEIYCKNGRYAIHDDSHNATNDQGSKHIYKNVRAIYEMSDKNSAGQLLGFNNTIGNGMAQGTEFLFEDCYFEFRGSNAHSAFYTHESGSKNHTYVPTLTFRRCQFWGGEGNTRTIRLQNLATADLQIPTIIEDCIIEGGIYLTIYSENSAQHYDVTVIRSGEPPVLVDKPLENKYPVKFEN